MPCGPGDADDDADADVTAGTVDVVEVDWMWRLVWRYDMCDKMGRISPDAQLERIEWTLFC